LKRRLAIRLLMLLAVTASLLTSPPAYAAPLPPGCTPSGAVISPAAPSATPSPGQSPTPAVAPTPDPGLACRNALVAQARQTLNANAADALGVQFQLAQSLSDNAREQADLGVRVGEAQDQILALDKQIETLDAQIVATQQSIDQDRAEAAAIARSLYFTPSSFLLSVFAAGSLQQLMTSASDRMVAGARAEVIERQLSDDLKKLQDEQTAATAARKEKTRAMESLKARLARLIQLAAYQQELAQRVAVQVGQVRAELGQVAYQDPALAQRILDQLEAQQTGIMAAASQQIWTQLRLWEQDAGSNPAAPQAPVSSRHSKSHPFVWPMPGAVISQGFGPTDLAIEPPYGGYAHFHTGLDLAAPELTPVLATDDGTVALVGGGDYGYGNYVVIAHRGGSVSLYGHLNQALVTPGQVVTQGQPVGLEGSTGHSTGPHLHFEVRVNNEPVDPTPYLPPGPPSNVGLNGS
jgi:murein DD-endopeptidase MepM/ murein hydrolase activator NlpD